MQKLRLSKPWNYKVPFLIGVPYFMMWVGKMGALESGIAFFMACCTIFGIAGFGYFMNDLTDRKEDEAAGKYNVLLKMPDWGILLLLLCVLAMAILPWCFYFPMDEISYALLIAEFALFILYSAPPFRFKERAWLGAICDAGYAHAVPGILAAWTFYLLGNKNYAHFNYYLIALGLWQFILGLRNILLHMLGDLEKDQKTDTQTLAVKKGKEAMENLLKYGFVPLEFLFFASFALVLTFQAWWFPLFCLFFLVQQYLKKVILWKQKLSKNIKDLLSVFLDEFYVQWIAVFVLIKLVLIDPWFLCLLIGHTVLFRNALKTLAVEFWQQWGKKLF